MKTSIFFALFVCCISFVSAQDYKIHTVAPKENYYSIGRLYNVPPKQIASLNNLNMEAGLQIGQKIKIPAQGAVVTTTAVARTIPVVESTPMRTTQATQHIVTQGEGLYRISKMYSVTVADIKKWNNLTSDDVKIGQILSINGMADPTQAAVAKNDKFEPVVKSEPAPAPAPVVKKDADTTFVYVNSVDPKATPTRRDDDGEKAVSIRGTTGVSKEPAPQIKEQPKEAPKQVMLKDSPRKENINTEMPLSDAPVEGAFANIFPKSSSGLSNKSGEAATFKSTSGWQDRKYYVLINDVAPGTILKISAADKIVYAKVLGNMPEMKENNGLLLRLSNAAASHLGIIDPKFPVEVSYYQ